MALLAAMVGVFGLLRPEELADHGGHSLWSKCWQFVSLFYCKTSQKLGHLMYTETEDGNRRPGDCFSFCACHVWHWLHLFWGKSNPGVMPVGGICSHWPPFSRMQVSQPVRQTDTVTEARCLMFPCRHIGSYRHFKAKNRNKTLHFAHHLRCGLSGVQFVWWRPRGPLTCKQLHDSSRANWRQQLVGCKWCRSQWSRWWGTTVFGATGLQHPGIEETCFGLAQVTFPTLCGYWLRVLWLHARDEHEVCSYQIDQIDQTICFGVMILSLFNCLTCVKV